MRHRARLLLPLLVLAALGTACANVVGSPEGWAAPIASPEAPNVVYAQTESGVLSRLELDESGNVTSLAQFPTEDDELELDAIYATPILDGGVLYVVAHSGLVVALDAESMRPLESWGEPTDLGAQVVSTPALDGDRLYVATERGDIHALDAGTGEIVSRVLQGEGRIWTEVARTGDTLYAGNLDNRRVRAVRVDGSLAWEQDLAGAAVSDFAIAGNLIYVGSFDRALHALDASTGSQVWRLDGDGWFAAPPMLADGRIIGATLGGSVYAADAGTGSELWRFNDDELAFRSRPVLAEGTLVLADRDGVLVGLDPETGAERWRQPLAGEEIEAHPLVMGERILYLTEDGDLVRVAPASGAVERLTGGEG